MQSLGDLKFCPELVELCSTRRVVGRSGRVCEVQGALSTVNNLITLRNLYLHLRPQRSLEVGLCYGASALLFTGSYRESGNPATGQHIALDPFQFTVWDDAGLLQIERAGLASFFDFRSEYSGLELPRLLAAGSRFDMIYVDGSHLFEDVFMDAYYACRLLTPGGVVAFDDCSDPHVAKVIRFLQKNCTEGLGEIDLEPYRVGIGRSHRYRLARWLGQIQMRAFRCIGKVERVWNAPFQNF